MQHRLRYLSHPEVQIDPAIPVPQWSLSEQGRRRTEKLVFASALQSTRKIVCSAEVKAIETATILASALQLDLEQREEMHENDRSSTGFLMPDEFQRAADVFFARPDTSFRGWETARDAQRRIVREVRDLLFPEPGGDILVVGHGAVGTLLYCHFAGEPISRSFDQVGGGGNFFSIDLGNEEPLHHWRPMEMLLQ